MDSLSEVRHCLRLAPNRFHDEGRNIIFFGSRLAGAAHAWFLQLFDVHGHLPPGYTLERMPAGLKEAFGDADSTPHIGATPL